MVSQILADHRNNFAHLAERSGVTWPLHGFAPGSYQQTCRVCGNEHIAAKSAWSCLPCAMIVGYTEAPADVPAPAEPAVEVTQAPAIDLDMIERETFVDTCMSGWSDARVRRLRELRDVAGWAWFRIGRRMRSAPSTLERVYNEALRAERAA